MKLFVIGNPIRHSKSPIIHNLWLKKIKSKIIYEKKLLLEEQLKSMVAQVKNQKCLGFNVTLPFKTKILKFIDYQEENVKKIKAANTIYIEKNKVVGANTDGEGFIKSLKYEVKMNFNNIKVFIIGAGGAARGILLALLKHPIKEVCICNRNIKNARKLKKDFNLHSINNKITLQQWQKKIIAKKYDLIINTTSYGMNLREYLNFNFTELKKRTVVYDLIYNPKETNFLKKAKRCNLKSYNGSGMLVRQAAESFSKWFKKSIVEEDIKEAKRLIDKK